MVQSLIFAIAAPYFTRYQVRYLGLLENIKVRRAGYAFRLEYDKFLERYKMLSKVTWPVWKGSPREGCKHASYCT